MPHCIRRARELHGFLFVRRKFLKTRKKTALLLDGKAHYIKESSELHDFLVGRKFSQVSFCEFLSSFFMKERTASNRKPHCIRKSSELHDFFLLDVNFLERVFVFFFKTFFINESGPQRRVQINLDIHGSEPHYYQ